MAATVTLVESNGGTPGSPATLTTLTYLNFSTVDTPNVYPASATNHPIVIPVSGYAYSMSKWIRICLANLGGGSPAISNFRFWKSAGTYVNVGGTAREGISTNIHYLGNPWANLMWITNYFHRTNGVGGAALTIYPVVGAGTEIGISSTQWYNGNSAIAVAAPSYWCPGIAGAQSGSLSTAPSYSDYIFIGLWCDSSMPDSSVTPSPQKTISYRYDES